MKVVIDKILCNGTGICDTICCQLRPHNEDADVVQQEIATEEYEMVCRKAAKYCPAKAIIVLQ